MNKRQKFALVIAALNLAVILLFPPFDQYSIGNAKVPIFAGFHFVAAGPLHGVVNASVLTLEAIVILINAGIAWLLVRDKPATASRRKLTYQNATLIVVALNLVVILLFPPFESVFALTNAALPTFEGFYFIFARQPNHTIVSTVLYLEVIFVLINGALVWLMFREKTAAALTPEQAYALAMELRAKSRKQ